MRHYSHRLIISSSNAPGKDDLLERRCSHLYHIRIGSNTWLLMSIPLYLHNNNVEMVCWDRKGSSERCASAASSSRCAKECRRLLQKFDSLDRLKNLNIMSVPCPSLRLDRRAPPVGSKLNTATDHDRSIGILRQQIRSQHEPFLWPSTTHPRWRLFQLPYRHPTIHSILRILIGRSKNHC